jgi:hypothetical protein
MNQRTSLVKAFRALADGKSKSTWGVVLTDAETQTGLIDPNDAHSILVSVAKSLKKPVREVHPVRLAPLTISLVDRILTSSEASFRTKAGTFGLVGRAGIDWSKHVQASVRDEFFARLSSTFQSECEKHFSPSLDPQTIGYCCESALLLNLISPEFTQVVTECVKETPFIPPLALVQIAQYLERVALNDPCDHWENIADRVISDIDSFSPQNLVSILQSIRSAGRLEPELVRRPAVHLAGKSGMLRLSDCVSLLESVSQTSDISDSPEVFNLVRSIRRRGTVLIITSPKRIPHTQLVRLSAAMSRLALPATGPLHWVTGSYSSLQPSQQSRHSQQFITS